MRAEYAPWGSLVAVRQKMPLGTKTTGRPKVAKSLRDSVSLRFGTRNEKTETTDPAQHIWRHFPPESVPGLKKAGLAILGGAIGVGAVLGLPALLPLGAVLAATGLILMAAGLVQALKGRASSVPVGTQTEAPTTTFQAADWSQKPVQLLHKTLTHVPAKQMGRFTVTDNGYTSLERLNQDLGQPKDNANFAGITFGDMVLEGIPFPPHADFRQIKLDGDLVFKNCKLNGANFEGAQGKGKLLLHNTEATGLRYDLPADRIQIRST